MKLRELLNVTDELVCVKAPMISYDDEFMAILCYVNGNCIDKNDLVNWIVESEVVSIDRQKDCLDVTIQPA